MSEGKGHKGANPGAETCPVCPAHSGVKLAIAFFGAVASIGTGIIIYLLVGLSNSKADVTQVVKLETDRKAATAQLEDAMKATDVRIEADYKAVDAKMGETLQRVNETMIRLESKVDTLLRAGGHAALGPGREPLGGSATP
jgi:hypothetical protein